MQLLLLLQVVVHPAGVEGERVGTVDRGSVEHDVDVIVAGNDRRKVFPEKTKKWARERCKTGKR